MVSAGFIDIVYEIKRISFSFGLPKCYLLSYADVEFYQMLFCLFR